MQLSRDSDVGRRWPAPAAGDGDLERRPVRERAAPRDRAPRHAEHQRQPHAQRRRRGPQFPRAERRQPARRVRRGVLPRAQGDPDLRHGHRGEHRIAPEHFAVPRQPAGAQGPHLRLGRRAARHGDHPRPVERGRSRARLFDRQGRRHRHADLGRDTRRAEPRRAGDLRSARGAAQGDPLARHAARGRGGGRQGAQIVRRRGQSRRRQRLCDRPDRSRRADRHPGLGRQDERAAGLLCRGAGRFLVGAALGLSGVADDRRRDRTQHQHVHGRRRTVRRVPRADPARARRGGWRRMRRSR